MSCCNTAPSPTTAPATATTASCGCSQSPPAAPARRPLAIEFLYLDQTSCSRCQDTGQVLEEAVDQITPALAAAGIDVSLRTVHVTSPEQAKALGLRTSPTIRVMGRDLQLQFHENHCESCSALSQAEVSCRAWSWRGQEYSSPPKGMLVEALLADAFQHTCGTRDAVPPLTELPENLRRFFAGRARQTGCC